MKAICINQQTFQLTDNEQLLGTIVYKGLFSYDAELVVTNTVDRYVIKSRNLFGTNLVVTKNETEIANLRMNLKGQIIISMSNGEEFLFKETSLLQHKFVIENQQEQRIVQYEPGMNWSKLNYNYTIAHNLKSQDTLFLLLGIYASNYFIAAMSGLV